MLIDVVVSMFYLSFGVRIKDSFTLLSHSICQVAILSTLDNQQYD